MRYSSGLGGAAAIAMALVLAACGGGGKKAPQPTPNQIPISNAGVDQAAAKGAAITLDGSASSDPDGNALSYRWTQTSGPAVSLSSGTTSRPTFTAPAASGTLAFTLIVNDGHADSIGDTVQVTINNRAPTANAGPDAAAEAGNLFTLDGAGSSDADNDTLTYTWTQLSGPPVTLTNVAPGRARFAAPTQVSHLEFGLIANDGEVSSAQDIVAIDVRITVNNQPPVAYVYGDFGLPKRAVGTLSGSGYDPDGFVLTYRWTQVSGPSVQLTDPNSPYATFTAPSDPAVLTFELVVSDGVALSDPERVVVTVENVAPDVYITGLTPNDPHTLDDLSVDAELFDADTDPLTVTYAWSRNGTVVPGVTGATYPASLTTRDDVIAVTVTASDGSLSTSVDASTTILDTPPTLTANAPSSVNYGDSVSFQVTASGDADGDPTGNFTVRLGPAGFDVSNGGAVSWQARLPMFDNYVDIAWSVGVEGSATAEVGGTIRVLDAARQVPLMRSGGTVPQNREQIVVSDIDANGVDDILLSDGRSLSIASKIGTNYEQVWAYPFNLAGEQNGIAAIAAGNVSGNAAQEIFVAADGHIRELDGVTRALVHEYNSSSAVLFYALRVADLDGDGSKELVGLATESSYYGTGGATMLIVLSAADLSLKGIINQTGLGTSMDVGNVDGDAALEIVTGNGYVYDGATRMNEWAFGPQFGNIVETGDVDGDGVDEIIAMTYTDARVFSAVTRTQRGIFTSGYCCGLAELRVAELGGDARREVLIGDSQWGNVSAFRYNPATQVFDQVFTLNSQDYGVSAIGVGNLDADANVEIVWGSGVGSSGQDVLVVAEQDTPTSMTVEWNSGTVGEFDGPFVGGLMARTAAGTRRLMFVSPSTMSGYGGAKLFALNPVTGETAHSSVIGSNWANAASIDVADTDSDGIDEVFLSSSDSYTPFYATYDFASDAREWTSPTGFSQAMAIAHADVTGDGNADFAAMGADGRVTIFNVAQSNIVWQSPALQGAGADVDLADLDHDGQLEVIALTDSMLYVFGRSSSSVPYTQRASVGVQFGSKVLAADVNGDGEVEIFALTGPGYYYGGDTELHSYDENLQSLHVATLTMPANNLALEPSAGARKNLLIASGNPSYSYYATTASEIWAIDPLSGAGVWRSPGLPGDFSRESLFAVDVNQDGQYELSFGTNVGAFVTR